MIEMIESAAQVFSHYPACDFLVELFYCIREVAMRTRKLAVDEPAWQTTLLNLADAVGPVSHELNNLLNNMVLQAALLDRALPEDLRERASAFRTMPLQASRLLQKLNDYRNQVQPPMLPVDLTAVVREVIGTCRARGWSVAAKLARNLPVLQGNSADLARLTDLLISAGNAAGPPVQVHTKRANDTILLIVEDAGPKVEAEKYDAFFDPMTPARPGENSIERAACQTIARRLGAVLEVRNLPRGGLAVMVMFASHSST